MKKKFNYLIAGILLHFCFTNTAYAETTMSAEGSTFLIL